MTGAARGGAGSRRGGEETKTTGVLYLYVFFSLFILPWGFSALSGTGSSAAERHFFLRLFS